MLQREKRTPWSKQILLLVELKWRNKIKCFGMTESTIFRIQFLRQFCLCWWFSNNFHLNLRLSCRIIGGDITRSYFENVSFINIICGIGNYLLSCLDWDFIQACSYTVFIYAKGICLVYFSWAITKQNLDGAFLTFPKDFKLSPLSRTFWTIEAIT